MGVAWQWAGARHRPKCKSEHSPPSASWRTHTWTPRAVKSWPVTTRDKNGVTEHIHPDLQGKLCAQWAFGHDEMLDGCCYFKLSDFLTKQNTPSSVNNTVSKTMCTFPTPLIHPEALLTAIFESLRFQNYHSSYPSAPPLRCTWGHTRRRNSHTPWEGEEAGMRNGLQKNDTRDLVNRIKVWQATKACGPQVLLLLETACLGVKTVILCERKKIP